MDPIFKCRTKAVKEREKIKGERVYNFELRKVFPSMTQRSKMIKEKINTYNHIVI